MALLFLRLHEKSPAFVIDGVAALNLAEEYMKVALSLLKQEEKHRREEAGGVWLHGGRVGFIGSASGVYAIAVACKLSTCLIGLGRSGKASYCLSFLVFLAHVHGFTQYTTISANTTSSKPT
jgi:hypothetical protein